MNLNNIQHKCRYDSYQRHTLDQWLMPHSRKVTDSVWSSHVLVVCVCGFSLPPTVLTYACLGQFVTLKLSLGVSLCNSPLSCRFNSGSWVRSSGPSSSAFVEVSGGSSSTAFALVVVSSRFFSTSFSLTQCFSSICCHISFFSFASSGMFCSSLLLFPLISSNVFSPSSSSDLHFCMASKATLSPHSISTGSMAAKVHLLSSTSLASGLNFNNFNQQLFWSLSDSGF